MHFYFINAEQETETSIILYGHRLDSGTLSTPIKIEVRGIISPFLIYSKSLSYVPGLISYLKKKNVKYDSISKVKKHNFFYTMYPNLLEMFYLVPLDRLKPSLDYVPGCRADIFVKEFSNPVEQFIIHNKIKGPCIIDIPEYSESLGGVYTVEDYCSVKFLKHDDFPNIGVIVCNFLVSKGEIVGFCLRYNHNKLFYGSVLKKMCNTDKRISKMNTGNDESVFIGKNSEKTRNNNLYTNKNLLDSKISGNIENINSDVTEKFCHTKTSNNIKNNETGHLKKIFNVKNSDSIKTIEKIENQGIESEFFSYTSSKELISHFVSLVTILKPSFLVHYNVPYKIFNKIHLKGLVYIDIFVYSQGVVKCREYSLKELCESFEINKKELLLSVINLIQEKEPSFKHNEYLNFILENFLIYNIYLKLDVLELSKELSQICGNLISRTLQNQRAERVEYLLLHECYERNILFPDKNKKMKEIGFTGGLVLSPKIGFYETLVLLLDFNSLYPSIIREFNVCFSTIGMYENTKNKNLKSNEKTNKNDENSIDNRNKEDDNDSFINDGNNGRINKHDDRIINKNKEDDNDSFINVGDNGRINKHDDRIINRNKEDDNDSFINDGNNGRINKHDDRIINKNKDIYENKNDDCKAIIIDEIDETFFDEIELRIKNNEEGFLPKILANLVLRRKTVKELIKKTKCPFQIQKLSTRQQALKLTANSIYGCLGCSHSRFSNHTMASYITFKGRSILKETKKTAEKLGMNVIYGDTDSIMIDTGIDGINNNHSMALKMGETLKGKINLVYKNIEIEIEKVMKKLALYTKKKYGALWIDKNGNSGLDCKGLDFMRRDYSQVCNDIVEDIFKTIMVDMEKDYYKYYNVLNIIDGETEKKDINIIKQRIYKTESKYNNKNDEKDIKNILDEKITEYDDSNDKKDCKSNNVGVEKDIKLNNIGSERKFDLDNKDYIYKSTNKNTKEGFENSNEIKIINNDENLQKNNNSLTNKNYVDDNSSNIKFTERFFIRNNGNIILKNIILEKLQACKENIKNLPIQKFVLSTQLKKNPEQYTQSGSLPHIALAQRLNKKGYSYKKDDIISYLIAKESSKNEHISNRAHLHIQENDFNEDMKHENSLTELLDKNKKVNQTNNAENLIELSNNEDKCKKLNVTNNENNIIDNKTNKKFKDTLHDKKESKNNLRESIMSNQQNKLSQNKNILDNYITEENKEIIDFKYYIENQIVPCLYRILNIMDGIYVEDINRVFGINKIQTKNIASSKKISILTPCCKNTQFPKETCDKCGLKIENTFYAWKMWEMIRNEAQNLYITESICNECGISGNTFEKICRNCNINMEEIIKSREFDIFLGGIERSFSGFESCRKAIEKVVGGSGYRRIKMWKYFEDEIEFHRINGI